MILPFYINCNNETFVKSIDDIKKDILEKKFFVSFAISIPVDIRDIIGIIKNIDISNFEVDVIFMHPYKDAISMLDDKVVYIDYDDNNIKYCILYTYNSLPDDIKRNTKLVQINHISEMG